MMSKIRRDDKMSPREGFSEDIAQKLGFSSRTIEREIQIARDIIPEVKEFSVSSTNGETEG